MPKTAEPWSLTSLQEKLIKRGAKVIGHGRYVTEQGGGQPDDTIWLRTEAVAIDFALRSNLVAARLD
jgi:hypothetical protein